MPYRMLDYIEESPAALAATLAENEDAVLALAGRVASESVTRIVVAGLGSSYTAARMAAPLLQRCSVKPVMVVPATDLALFPDRFISSHSVVILVSRSGERGWISNAQRAAAARGARCVAITGVSDSLLARAADTTLLTREGAESAFAKTKSVAAACGLLMRLGLALADPGDSAARALLAQLRAAPDLIARTIASVGKKLEAVTPWVAPHRYALVAGVGSNYGVALEGAIKIQEAACVPAQADDTGNVLHGALGVLDSGWLYIGLVTSIDAQLSLAALRLIGDFGAHRLVIAEPGVDTAGCADHTAFVAGSLNWLIAGMAFLAPVQLLAYHWALARGMNPDRPAFSDAMLRAMLPTGRNEPHWSV